MAYDDLSVRDAFSAFMKRNGFSEGEYSDPLVWIPMGPVSLPIPNTRGRQAVVRMHDLHHIATGYDTDHVGEAEIGAFELAAGCTRFEAYLYNGMAVALGFVLAPRRVLAAYRRGRAARTLYRAPLSNADLDAMSVRELRAHLRIA
ncbi:MAG: hypothetical protein AAF645_16985 [Myxococcota bacterium]